jgi:hypothetical protein
MSRMMLLGVLRMPIGMVQGDFLSLSQYVDRGHQAADVIDKADRAIALAEDLLVVLRARGPIDDALVGNIDALERALAEVPR